MSLAEFVTFSDPKWTNPSYNDLSNLEMCLLGSESSLDFSLPSSATKQWPWTMAPQTRFGTPYMDGTPLSNCAIPPGRNHARRTLPLDQDIWLIWGWTSIYQLFWCSPGVQGFDTLPYLITLYYFVILLDQFWSLFESCFGKLAVAIRGQGLDPVEVVCPDTGCYESDRLKDWTTPNVIKLS